MCTAGVQTRFCRVLLDESVRAIVPQAMGVIIGASYTERLPVKALMEVVEAGSAE
uniref:Uncharacterized protein n=1 Tax=Physcomitrium patens TaxID=3218 RepID=A0A2K1INI8_PHYPA|nr:hypothetical protein PHYPA_027157 [Physcomitrium patens]